MALNREEMLAKIDVLYDGRQTGDQSKYPDVLAPHAEFRFVGDGSIVMDIPGGKTNVPGEVAKELFEKLDMLHRKIESSTIEEGRAAVHWRVRLQFKGGAPFEMEWFDLWEFDDQGRITKGSQFLDTAQLQNEMDDAEMAASAAATREATQAAKDQAARIDSMDFGLGSS